MQCSCKEKDPMLRIIITIGIAVLCARSAGAQMTFAPEFRTPSSPAYVLLGIEPATVERPTTPQAFAASTVLLGQSLREGVLPENYALECAPYWLTSHPELTFENYYGAGVLQRVLQTASLSILTADESTSEKVSYVGAGVRWQFVSGRASDSLSQYVTALKAVQNKLLDAENGDSIGMLRAEAAGIALRIQTLDHERTGLIIEGAFAAAGGFREKDVKQMDGQKIGFWLSSTYRLSQPSIDMTALLRVLHSAIDGDNHTAGDVGGRIGYRMQKLSIAAEAVYRSDIDSPPDGGAQEASYRMFRMKSSARVCGILDYEINDYLWLNAAFGKGFDTPGQGNMLSQLGLSWGFGGKPTLQM